MPRFYSADWIAAFNEAVDGLAPAASGLAEAGDSRGGTVNGSPADQPPAEAGRARFRVAQVVSGAPEGDLRVVLDVSGDRLRLERRDGGLDADDDPPADVTVVLSYEDAAALSRGELDATRMVGTGRLKVRGNLSLLVAGQTLLAAAADRLAPLAASTTY